MQHHLQASNVNEFDLTWIQHKKHTRYCSPDDNPVVEYSAGALAYYRIESSLPPTNGDYLPWELKIGDDH
ncbi:unnamed protein product [Toxocara canis]|uniref:Uncharacterized protein n=1 Tax=Toxocara canis TaxID=6265 RepID=A0A183UG90_TOXCA|nr:unnamed protein product [Toxocara canis]